LIKAQLIQAQEVLNFSLSPLSPSGHQKQARKEGLVAPGRYSLSPSTSGGFIHPLVESSVRRSTRIRRGSDAFHSVRLEEESSKKRNEHGVVLIDESTGQVGPAPIEILQGWGFKCGIPPAELSQEALMQAPANNPTSNEDTSA